MFYQEGEEAKDKSKKKLIATTGSDIPLNGICLYFLRINTDKDLTEKTLDKVCYTLAGNVSHL